jgi:hypothetical protein
MKTSPLSTSTESKHQNSSCDYLVFEGFKVFKYKHLQCLDYTQLYKTSYLVLVFDIRIVVKCFQSHSYWQQVYFIRLELRLGFVVLTALAMIPRYSQRRIQLKTGSSYFMLVCGVNATILSLS